MFTPRKNIDRIMIYNIIDFYIKVKIIEAQLHIILWILK